IGTGDRAGAVAKGRLRGYVLDALAVDIDLAAVTQAFKVLGAREGAGRPDHVFWLLPMHRSLRSPASTAIIKYNDYTANMLRAGLIASPIIIERFFEFR